MVVRRGNGLLCLVLVLCIAHAPTVSATCATFAAWLTSASEPRAVQNQQLENGFVAITVAPDMESLEVNWQIKSSTAGGGYITSIGIYGPALEGEEKPGDRGMLLDLQSVAMRPGEWGALRLRLTSHELPFILTLMREGRSYVNVVTKNNLNGELRGQIYIPQCLEGALMGETAPSRGYVNVLLSGSSLAVLAQVAPDASVATAGSISVNSMVPQVITLSVISPEWTPLQPGMGQLYNVLVDATTEAEALASVMTGVEATVTVSGEGELSGTLHKALGCRKLLTAQDSLFTLARAHGTDWLSVWSMNPGQPDRRLTLEPRYFAHPLEVALGDTGEAIARRFGMTMKDLQRANPELADLSSLHAGSTICVVPDWSETTSGNGRRICSF